MEEKKYPRVGETLYHEVLENGLHIYVDPKPEFGKYYAFFATNYGGMDVRFQLDGEWHDTPEGVAHFLEHKMFDTKDGNALQDLAANGASPNAFTSNAITGYYFECTEKFEDNLKTLLSFVSVPWFTPESVDKEQGIIGQEIRMVEDDPNWRVYMNLTGCLYQNHSIKISVIGTQESIAQITDKTLYACHKAFYDPSNMVLCVAGNVDPERIVEIAREILPAGNSPEIGRDHGGEEPDTVAAPEAEMDMDVSTPIFLLGFKADPPPEDGEGKLRQALTGELACEALMGTSSALYAELYEKGLLNKSFSCEYEDYPGCAFLCAGGESPDPRAVRQAVLDEARRMGEEGIDEALWKRLKKAAYGSRVRSLNSFENICVELAQAHFAGEDYFSFPEVYDRIEKENVEACIRRWVTPERTALSVVKPREDT
ncbi:MAG: EF-P 5-aminopentanol modification-associated protein YfmH [Oscillospiraceae bacterium]